MMRRSISIEAKPGIVEVLYIIPDQLLRSLLIGEMFGNVILAFKFMRRNDSLE
jgi:hypothetical protein